MNVLKNEKVNSVIIIIAFIFNIIIFAPIEMYFTNKNEFWFAIKDILPIILILAVVLLILNLLIFFIFRNKKNNIFRYTLFSLLLGLYIQGNFLNFGYSVLDGSKVNWNSMIYKGIINICIWIVIFLIPYIFNKKKKEDLFNIISSCISIFIFLIETITLITVIIINSGENSEIKNGLNNNNIFNLSKDENIVVFMADTFDGIYMNEILEEMPEYKEKFKDFTYFDNCTGPSFYTFSSMPILLTGEENEVGKNLQENLDKGFQDTKLYNILKENGYSTELYLEKALISSNEKADNLNTNANQIKTKFSIKALLGKQMYKYVLYRYLPHFLKANFEVSSDDFNQIKSSDESIEYKSSTYYLDDVMFNKVLLDEGISSNEEKKSFKFYELNGLHIHNNTTPEVEYDNSTEYMSKPEKERKLNEGKASLNILCNYINELKKAKVYDNTTIILLADHGFENRFYTTLLVKKANEKHDFEINSAPVSLLEDLIPTISNIASKSKNYGRDFFDYLEGEERTRRILDFTYSTRSTRGNDYKAIAKLTFETKDIARNIESYYLAKDEYENENKDLKNSYEFGNVIRVKDILKSDSINLTGFVLENLSDNIITGWNIGRECYLILKRADTKKDVTAKFFITEVLDDNQEISFSIDGKNIYTKILNKTIEGQEISFSIPKGLWNKNETLEIKIELPDAYLGLYHQTMMAMIHLESISFEN